MVGRRVHVPSFDMGMVENFHLIVVHLVVDSLKKRIMKRAVFLDRDGVLNEERSDYVKCWGEFSWLPGTKEALRRLRSDGLLTIVVTNQSAVGMGLLDEEGLDEIHSTMLREIESAGGGIDRIYYCPHPPGTACDCRIPRPGLLLKAARDFDISLQDSYMISDGIEDLGMARELGCRTILVCNGHLGRKIPDQTGLDLHPDYALPDLSSAVEVILKLENYD
jgi:D-glycero-D-manno-heptose 1,7-bisphosphate phosphatase